MLVTGATGKVGAAIVRALLASGMTVRALVRNPARAGLPSDVEPVVGDLRDGSGLEDAVEGCCTVYNAAGVPEQWVADSAAFFEINAAGTRLLAEAAARVGVRRFVHTSTIDVFDAALGEMFDEHQLSPRARSRPYQRSKQEAEHAVIELASVIEVVVVNSAAVLGLPARAQSVERSLIEPALGDRLPVLPPGGLNLVSADSLADAHLRGARLGRAGERYIVSDGYLTVRELVQKSLAAVGKQRVPPSLPQPAAVAIARLSEPWAHLRRRPPLIAKDQLVNLLWQARASSAKVEHELGWRPSPLGETIAALATMLAPLVPEKP